MKLLSRFARTLPLGTLSAAKSTILQHQGKQKIQILCKYRYTHSQFFSPEHTLLLHNRQAKDRYQPEQVFPRCFFSSLFTHLTIHTVFSTKQSSSSSGSSVQRNRFNFIFSLCDTLLTWDGCRCLISKYYFCFVYTLLL